ncbi:leucine-rich repeat domain-containing protein [Anaeromicrobium sediminis]|uniref:Uncharacterized protein n=1 Tax=Anaeromicrobium sediminis TaxID=1478221 RepID=A0A267MP75_9FIRM|nr:hypothetical protein [Anaeromicrobium sediminis]PAB60695.1 hypothetical protein CCE28_03920 [Anaeromicrobium sediminis]
MEAKNIRDYKRDILWGSVGMVAFMVIHLFVTDMFINGASPAVWIGLLIGVTIRNCNKGFTEKEGFVVPIVMIINYLLFKVGVYIPTEFVLFGSLSGLLIYYVHKGYERSKRIIIPLILILLSVFLFLNYYMFKDNIIKDRAFYKFVKKEYNITGDITEEDLGKIEKLSLKDNINRLDGIEKFKNLKVLRFWYGRKIESLKPIDKLKNVEELWFWYINLDKIQELDTMESVTWLEITYPKGGSLESLKNMPNLKKLAIQGMDMDNLNMLKGLKHLEELHVSDGYVKSLYGLEALQSIKTLSFYKIHNLDIDKIFELKNLEKIKLNGATVNDREKFDKIVKERNIQVEERTPVNLGKIIN